MSEQVALLDSTKKVGIRLCSADRDVAGHLRIGVGSLCVEKSERIYDYTALTAGHNGCKDGQYLQ